jgi:hypothetical protein
MLTAVVSLRRPARIDPFLPFAFPVMVRIDLSEMSPLRGKIIKSEDGRNGTDRDARPAIDAFLRIDVELRR